MESERLRECVEERLAWQVQRPDGMRLMPAPRLRGGIQSRGALKRELVACLRTGRALRVPRARVRQRSKGHINDEVMISQRSAEAEDWAVPGHWEGDSIIGTGRSAIGTLVERTSSFTLPLHLPASEGAGPRLKHGPAVTGAGAEQVRDAIAAQLGELPEHRPPSLTWTRARSIDPTGPRPQRAAD